MTYRLDESDLADIAFTAFGINGLVRVGTDDEAEVGPKSPNGNSTAADSRTGFNIAFLSSSSKQTSIEMAGVSNAGFDLKSLNALEYNAGLSAWIKDMAGYCAKRALALPDVECYTMLMGARLSDCWALDPLGDNILIIQTPVLLDGHVLFYDHWLKQHVLFCTSTIGNATPMCVLKDALYTYTNGVSAGDFRPMSSSYPIGKYLPIAHAHQVYAVRENPNDHLMFGNLPKEPKEPHCQNCGPSKIMFAKGDLWKCWWCEGTVKR